MPTIQDVARVAGVSTATVSHVVNNSKRVTPATAARVKRAIAQLKFVPNATGRLLALQRNAPISTRKVDPSTSSSSTAKPTGSNGAPQVASSPLPFNAPQLYFSASGETARAMLRIVRAAQPISRADLARRLEINRSQVTEM